MCGLCCVCALCCCVDVVVLVWCDTVARACVFCVNRVVVVCLVLLCYCCVSRFVLFSCCFVAVSVLIWV